MSDRANGSPSRARWAAALLVGVVVAVATGFALLRAPLAHATSSNADLSSLTVSQGALSPSFGPSTLSYTDTTAASSLAVAATVADGTATMKINGTPTASGANATIPLVMGANAVTVAVTASDGVTTKSYVINVTRAAASNDAALAGLAVSPDALTQAFTPATVLYSAVVSSSTDYVEVTPTVDDPTAVVTVAGTPVASGWSVMVPVVTGQNVINIVVSASDGVTSRTYTILVTRKSPAKPAPASSSTPSPVAPVTPVTPSVSLAPAAAHTSGSAPVDGSYLTSRELSLQVTAPVEATAVEIADTADLADAKVFPISASGVYGWTLAGEGAQTVYVRFLANGQPVGDTLTQAVKVDDRMPVAGKAAVLKTHLRRAWLALHASDDVSGVAFVQFSPSPKTVQWAWSKYQPRLALSLVRRTIWFRVADAAGNTSAWQQIALPKR